MIKTYEARYGQDMESFLKARAKEIIMHSGLMIFIVWDRSMESLTLKFFLTKHSKFWRIWQPLKLKLVKQPFFILTLELPTKKPFILGCSKVNLLIKFFVRLFNKFQTLFIILTFVRGSFNFFQNLWWKKKICYMFY